MIGAGISTSAGIPDFRSNTGLFKQLQDKYNLSSPEEFFLLTTFYSNPKYFYEFTKLFDLSKINSTITHKFINYFVHKNIVKYIFTQNIDGLEIKAKIPKEKLIFAHGSFYEGNCPRCDIPIDIEKINEGIEKGEVYYCPQCKGPTKPYVVFYGEGLPKMFFQKIEESKDTDLIIIMGTSLKVRPFANIPFLTNNYAFKMVFNMEKVGDYGYNYLEDDSIFIKGKTDANVIKFLKDIDMLDEFAEFVKKEYNEDLNSIINIENKLINVNDKKENEEIEELTENLNDLDFK
jgi:NAD-dependent histone deacetylase SIR2